jgi:hypothetical protein
MKGMKRMKYVLYDGKKSWELIDQTSPTKARESGL